MKENEAGYMLKIMILTILISTFCFNDTRALDRSSQEADEKDNNSGYILLPVLSYMPETKLAGGAVVNYYFRESGSDHEARPSMIMPAFIYTQKKQISSEISTALYWDNEAYYLNGYISYRKFPDKFYGVGNTTDEHNEEPYTPQTFQLRLSFQKKLLFDSYIGLLYELEHNKLVKVEDNGLLDTGRILGSNGGATSGLGVLMHRDARDNIFYPSSGNLYQVSVQFYNQALGSDYNFSKYSVDVRSYHELFPSHILAFQGYVNIMDGKVPFQKLSLLGQIGEHNLMRGYYQGRYRDKNIFVVQTEYRMPLWRRLGAVAFIGVGDVAGDVKAFNTQTLKYSYGGGLRFKLNKEEGIHLRLDFGFGDDVSGFYFTIGEAF